MDTNKLSGLSSQFNNGPNQNNKQIKIGNYILGRTIGKGNSAVVKIATHAIIKQKVAIKMFDKSVLDVDKQVRLMREIESMKKLKHPNIIRIYEIMETAKIICIVTEIASNGELYDYIIHKKRLSEREAKHIFKQIVAGIHHCHKNNVVHRDIKVENILLDNNGRVKLADFGFSAFFKPGELMDAWCGSPQYCAPELYMARLYEGPNVDIWSLGVVLYVLVCGYLPFEAQVFNQLRAQIINGSFKTPFFLSADCKNLIDGMLTLDPEKRIKMNDIINHKWLQCDTDYNMLSNITDVGLNLNELAIYKDFRNLVDKIEQISINEFEPDEFVLLEISKYGLNIHEIINSVRNNEFDSNAAIYYLLESKLATNNNTNGSMEQIRKVNPFNSISMNRNRSNEEELAEGSGSNANAEKSYMSYLEEIHANAIQANDIKTNQVNINEALKNNLEQKFDDKMTEDDEEEDDGMLIEQLGRDYLSRNNTIRRHTIGTNSDKERGSDIVKSTECLLMLDENEEYDKEKIDQSFKPYMAPQENQLILDTKYIIPCTSTTQLTANTSSMIEAENSKKSTIEKTFDQQKLLSCMPYGDDQNYKPFIPSPNRFAPGSQHHRFIDSNNSNSLLQFANRRASDGGSNIVLFNQIYASKNSDNSESTMNSSKNQDTQENSNSSQTSTKYLSRGSITSGIPIFPSTSQLSPSQTSSDSQYQNSSEDEEPYPNNIYRYQRKNSRSRHEPYMDAANVAGNLLNAGIPSKRKSFSGSTSPPVPTECGYSKKQSDPLDLIYSNRAHLEGIYNRSINALTPAKELFILQQENPTVDEQTQIRWQKKHRKSILSQFESEGFLNTEKVAFQSNPVSTSPGVPSSNLSTKSDQGTNLDLDLTDQSQSSMEILNNDATANLSLLQNSSKSANQMLHIIREEQNEIQMLSSCSSSSSSTPRTVDRIGVDLQFENEVNLLQMLQNKQYCENNIKLVNQFLNSTMLNGFNINEDLMKKKIDLSQNDI